MQTYILKGKEDNFPITLQITSEKRIWRDSNFKIITEYNNINSDFNILDCELCYYFISQNIKETETRLTYDIFAGGVFNVPPIKIIEINDHSSDNDWDEFETTLPDNIIENILNTQINTKLFISLYDPMPDWMHVVKENPKTYLDIYKKIIADSKYLLIKDNKIALYDFYNRNPITAKQHIRFKNINEEFLKNINVNDIEYIIQNNRKFYKVLDVGWDR